MSRQLTRASSLSDSESNRFSSKWLATSDKPVAGRFLGLKRARSEAERPGQEQPKKRSVPQSPCIMQMIEFIIEVACPRFWQGIGVKPDRHGSPYLKPGRAWVWTRYASVVMCGGVCGVCVFVCMVCVV